jgi:hypothetical protein
MARDISVYNVAGYGVISVFWEAEASQGKGRETLSQKQNKRLWA